MLLVRFQGKPFNIRVIQVHASTTNAKEAEVEQCYEDLPYLLELTPKKKKWLYYGGLECEIRKSRDTHSNKQVWPWNTKWTKAKANRVLSKEDVAQRLYPSPTNQEITLHMDITRWTVPKSDWLCSLQPKMEKLYTVSKNKTWSWLWLRSWAPYCKI